MHPCPLSTRCSVRSFFVYKREHNVISLFFAPLYVCKGLCRRYLPNFYTIVVDFSASTNYDEVPNCHCRNRTNIKVQPCTVATKIERLLTNGYLAKSNGKDLNLVNGDMDSLGMSRVFCFLRCFAEHKLPLETGLARFGLAYDGIKIRCLTAWL